MKCPVCFEELRVEGSLSKDYGYCPKCLRYRKQKDTIHEGMELTIQQRLAWLEVMVKKLLEEKVSEDERSGGESPAGGADQ